MTPQANANRPAIFIVVCSLLVSIGCDLPPVDPPDTVPSRDPFDDAFVETTGDPGWTQGAWTVNDDGSSAYVVPLWVPPGRNGMQPQLALSYNSRGGNGLVGFGWSLSGLSAITTCPHTVLSSGSASAPAYDDTDTFCLDGAHLEVVDEGALGEGEYRVFRNGLVRVDRIDGGFRVWHPDGRIATYGVADDARFGATAVPRVTPEYAHGVAVAWLISRIEDRSGNAIEFHYGSRHEYGLDGIDQDVAEYWPTQITYTHGGSGGPALRSVRFVYDETARPDPIHRFVRGVALAVTRRLVRIEMWAPTRPGEQPRPVRQYAIDHLESDVSGRSVVRWIRECDGAGVCRDPITIDSTGVDPVLLEGATASGMVNTFPLQGDVVHNGLPISGDFFGDGYEHILQRGTYWAASAPGADPRSPWTRVLIDWPLRQNDALIPFDYDGDSRTELLRYFHDPATESDPLNLAIVRLHRSDETLGYMEEVTRLARPCGSSAARVTPAVADVDGDGQPDIIHGCTVSGTTNWYVLTRDRHNALAFYGSTSPFATTDSPQVTLADANGDGRTDIVFDDGRTFAFTFRGLEELVQPMPDFETLPDGTIARRAIFYFDANDDGLADALYTQGEADVYVRFNTGDGFTAPLLMSSTAAFRTALGGRAAGWYAGLHPNDFRAVDLDRDGRLDLIAYQDAALWEPIGINAQRQSPITAGARAEGRYSRVVFYYNRPSGFVVEVPYGTDGSDFIQPALASWYIRDDDRGEFECKTTALGSTEVFPCSRLWPSTFLFERGDELIMLAENLRTYRIYRTPPDMMVEVSRGTERDVWFQYELQHFAPRKCSYPDRCGGLARVVTSHEDEHGTRFTHDYVGPRTATDGDGWLGFEWHQFRDETTSLVVTRQHDMTDLGERIGHAFAPAVSWEIDWIRDSRYAFSAFSETLSRREVRTLDTGGSFVPVVSERVDTWETDGPPAECADHPCLNDVLLPALGHRPLTRVSTEVHYRGTGAVETVVETVDGVETRTTTLSDYDDRPIQWQFRLARNLSTTSTMASGRLGSLSTSFVWDEAGRAHVIDNGLTTSTIYYVAETGLVDHVTTEGPDIEPRTIQIEYDDAESMFPEHQWNALNHETVTRYLPATGSVVWTRSSAGVESYFSYDGLGRPRAMTERGITNTIDYETGPVGTTPAFETVSVRLRAPGGTDVSETVDRFGRTHRRSWQGWSGQAVEEFIYDERGRPRDHHVPHYGTDTHRIERVVLDEANRPRVLHRSFLREWSFIEYAGLTETTRSMDGRITGIVTYDEAGRIKESHQSAGDDEGDTTLTYSYGPFNSLEVVADQDGNAWRTEYDDFFRPVGSYDPDSGWNCIARNSLGELTDELDSPEAEDESCKDFGGPITDPIAHYEHDALGRLVRSHHRTDGDSQFFWDAMILPRFRGHPGTREHARGVFDGEEEAQEVQRRVQGRGRASLPGRRQERRAGREGLGPHRDRAA